MFDLAAFPVDNSIISLTAVDHRTGNKSRESQHENFKNLSLPEHSDLWDHSLAPYKETESNSGIGRPNRGGIGGPDRRGVVDAPW